MTTGTDGGANVSCATSDFCVDVPAEAPYTLMWTADRGATNRCPHRFTDQPRQPRFQRGVMRINLLLRSNSQQESALAVEGQALAGLRAGRTGLCRGCLLFQQRLLAVADTGELRGRGTAEGGRARSLSAMPVQMRNRRSHVLAVIRACSLTRPTPICTPPITLRRTWNQASPMGVLTYLAPPRSH